MPKVKVLRTVIPAALNNIRQGATMLAIKNYTNNYGEISHFGIVFHVDYLKAVKKSLDTWKQYNPSDLIEEKVKSDLIDSYSMTLSGHNPRAISVHAYCRITDGKNLIKSVKWLDNDRAIHFWGFLVHKRVLKSGTYPIDNRSQWVIYRERLLNMTPLSRFRQFKIVEGRFESIGVEKLTLTELDLLRTVQ